MDLDSRQANHPNVGTNDHSLTLSIDTRQYNPERGVKFSDDNNARHQEGTNFISPKDIKLQVDMA